MAETGIPDLWHLGEAQNLYQLYLGRLSMAQRPAEMVTAARTIREYAAGAPGNKSAGFTFYWEFQALCELHEYDAAWELLRQRDTLLAGREINLNGADWSQEALHEVLYSYAPLAYFRGEYELGVSLMERALNTSMCNDVPSFELLFKVFNGEETPSSHHRVTLHHFYDRLGRDLCQWAEWERFVDGFDPRLFETTGVTSADVRHDSKCFARFFERLMEIRDRRTTSGVSWGEADLVDRAEVVESRHAEAALQIDEHRGQVLTGIDAKLREHFPRLFESE